MMLTDYAQSGVPIGFGLGSEYVPVSVPVNGDPANVKSAMLLNDLLQLVLEGAKRLILLL
jgi:hypothetical protein